MEKWNDIISYNIEEFEQTTIVPRYAIWFKMLSNSSFRRAIAWKYFNNPQVFAITN